MLSFIFRFIANCRGEKRRGPLDVQEINQAEVTLIRIVQLQEFKKDIMSLKENNRVSAESLIKSLNPFLDKDGANAELKRLYKLVINPDPELAGFLVDENINWKFLPPRAPNFGGLWEAGVKSFKFHFKQISKWKFEKDNARVGDLVLIKEDNLAVNKWLMGRLIEVFPGKDNRIRVVTIKTQHGVVKRPISKICILPMRE
ncbi:uncharacterized protein TNCV_613411 [Trichonephila clavipes]|nr:uncharacterized protein TNCV_613411 [Trichonephila clavipes]